LNLRHDFQKTTRLKDEKFPVEMQKAAPLRFAA